MKDAALNMARVAEFAWANLEPAEGDFQFQWLDEFLDLAHAHEIHVILGTPTAIMPAWLVRKYPESLAMKPDGTRIVWGGRRHNFFSYPMFSKLALRIATTMAEHFGDHGAVIGWQIDNELGGQLTRTDCRCEHCRAAFQGWLEKRLEALPS